MPGKSREESKIYKIAHLKQEFEAGKIKSWPQVFAFYAKTTLAKDCSIHFEAFNRKVANPSEFTLSDILAISKAIDVDYRFILKFLFDLVPKSKKHLSFPGIIL